MRVTNSRKTYPRRCVLWYCRAQRNRGEIRRLQTIKRRCINTYRYMYVCIYLYSYVYMSWRVINSVGRLRSWWNNVQNGSTVLQYAYCVVIFTFHTCRSAAAPQRQKFRNFLPSVSPVFPLSDRRYYNDITYNTYILIYIRMYLCNNNNTSNVVVRWKQRQSKRTTQHGGGEGGPKYI